MGGHEPRPSDRRREGRPDQRPGVEDFRVNGYQDRAAGAAALLGDRELRAGGERLILQKLQTPTGAEFRLVGFHRRSFEHLFIPERLVVDRKCILTQSYRIKGLARAVKFD